MKTGKEQGHEWWLGLADIVTHGVAQGVYKLERVHLSIADETFNVLDPRHATLEPGNTVHSSQPVTAFLPQRCGSGYRRRAAASPSGRASLSRVTQTAGLLACCRCLERY